MLDIGLDILATFDPSTIRPYCTEVSIGVSCLESDYRPMLSFANSVMDNWWLHASLHIDINCSWSIATHTFTFFTSVIVDLACPLVLPNVPTGLVQDVYLVHKAAANGEIVGGNFCGLFTSKNALEHFALALLELTRLG